MTNNENIEKILSVTEPLKFSRGKRLPMFVLNAGNPEAADDSVVENYIRELDRRGIAMYASWNPKKREETLAAGLRIARLQKKAGLPVNIEAIACLNSFFNGDPKTGHIDEKGAPFFDDSFGKDYQMGCPFSVEWRIPAIREQVAYFVNGYKNAGLPVDFIFVDWEIDGPTEWNAAWEHSKRCQRCRENIKNIDDFAEFQKALRLIRCRLQKEAYADVLTAAFPNVLVGNYAVYPNNGWRCWYDFFEVLPDGAPFQADQQAKDRPWFQEFPLCGFTCAMPTLYTWYPTFQWYNFKNTDYRWFYNMLKEASIAGESAPASLPVISFVHWHTTVPPPNPDPVVKQFSEAKYQELLWHMFLRGHDTMFLYYELEELEKETRLLHQVYAAAMEYREFLDNGTPVSFAVPKQEGPVVSGLRLENRVLIRRTDFTDTQGPVPVTIEGRTLNIPRLDGKCQIFTI